MHAVVRVRVTVVAVGVGLGLAAPTTMSKCWDNKEMLGHYASRESARGTCSRSWPTPRSSLPSTKASSMAMQPPWHTVGVGAGVGVGVGVGVGLGLGLGLW